MAYEVLMPYHLHMPSYFLGTFTEYPQSKIVWEMCCNSPFSGIPLATNHLWQGGFLIYKEATHHSFHFFFSVSSASSVVNSYFNLANASLIRRIASVIFSSLVA